MRQLDDLPLWRRAWLVSAMAVFFWRCTSLPPIEADGACGNGVVDPGEQCDPGRLRSSSSECLDTCLLACNALDAADATCQAIGFSCIAISEDGRGFCAAPSGSFSAHELLSSDAEFEVADLLGDYRAELVLFDNNSISIRSDIRFAENSTVTLTSREESFVSPIGQVSVANINGDRYADILVASNSGLHVFSAAVDEDDATASSRLLPTSFAFGALSHAFPVIAASSVGDVPSRQLFQVRFEQGDSSLTVSTTPAPREQAFEVSENLSALTKPDCFDIRTAKLYASQPTDHEEDFAFTLYRQTLAQNSNCESDDAPGLTSDAERTIFLVDRTGLAHKVFIRTLAPTKLSSSALLASFRVTSAPSLYRIDEAPESCHDWMAVTGVDYSVAGSFRLGLSTVSMTALRDDSDKTCSVDINGTLPGGQVTDLFRELQTPTGAPFCGALDDCIFDDLEVQAVAACPNTLLPKVLVLALRGNELFRFEGDCGETDLQQTGRATLGSGAWRRGRAIDINHDGARDYIGALEGDDDIEVMRSNPNLPDTFVYGLIDTVGPVEDFVVGDFDSDGFEDVAYVEVAPDGMRHDVFAVYGDGAGWGQRQFLARFAEIVSIDAAVLGVAPTGGLPEGSSELVVAGRRDGADAAPSLYIFQGGSTRFMSSPVLIMSETTAAENGGVAPSAPVPFKVRPVTRAAVGNFVTIQGETAPFADLLLISRPSNRPGRLYMAPGVGAGQVEAALPIEFSGVGIDEFGVGNAHWTVATDTEGMSSLGDTLVGIDAEQESADVESTAHQNLVLLNFEVSPSENPEQSVVSLSQAVGYDTMEYYGLPMRISSTSFHGVFAGILGTFLYQSPDQGMAINRLVWWGRTVLDATEDEAQVLDTNDIAPCYDAAAIDMDGELPIDLAVVCARGVYAYIGGVDQEPVPILEDPGVVFDARSRMRVGDIEGNGVADLVVVDASKRVWVLLQNTVTQQQGACAQGQGNGAPCGR